MELRKDAQYDVNISTPDGTLVSLSKTDCDTAYAACKSIQDSSKDEKLLDALGTVMRSFGFCGYSGNGYSVSVSARLPRTVGVEKQTCGRRISGFNPSQRGEGLDTWDKLGKDTVCSYCGSLHPDRVIELIKEFGFGIIDRTDKNYKMYVRQPGVPNASFGGIKYYRHHDTDEFIISWNELLAPIPVPTINSPA